MHKLTWLMAQSAGLPLLPLLLVSCVMLWHADIIVLFFCRISVQHRPGAADSVVLTL